MRARIAGAGSCRTGKFKAIRAPTGATGACVFGVMLAVWFGAVRRR